MGYLDGAVAEKIAGLHKADASACKGIATRLANMSISSAAASSALCSMIDQDAVPGKDICAATPSLFKMDASHAAPEGFAHLAPSAS